MPIPDTNFQTQLTVYNGSPGGSVVKLCRHEDDSYFDLPLSTIVQAVEKDDIVIEILETLKKTKDFLCSSTNFIECLHQVYCISTHQFSGYYIPTVNIFLSGVYANT